MTNFDFAGLILNDRLYAKEDLLIFARNKLNTNIPEWEAKIFGFIVEFLDDKDFIEQLSSGTTGPPKIIKLPKKAMVESARLSAEVLGLKFGEKALLCLSIDYIAGKMMVVRAMVAGLNLFWEEPSSMPSLAKHGKIHFCAMVPLQVYNSFSNYEFFRNIEILILGGAEVRSEIRAMFRDVKNMTYETYGMTETCSHIALRRISGELPDKYFSTLPGITVETDSRGCLVAHVPYLDRPVVTNDLAEVIDPMHFIWIGRLDNIINTGGIKVKPEELETAISKVIDYDCAITGIPHPKLGQAIAIVVESVKPIDEKDLQVLLKEALPSHQLPKKIFRVDKLPRTSSYKIDRAALQALISEK